MKRLVLLLNRRHKSYRLWNLCRDEGEAQVMVEWLIDNGVYATKLTQEEYDLRSDFK